MKRLTECLRDRASRRPEDPALVWTDCVYTYSALDQSVRSMGALLRSYGIRAGMAVGSTLPNSDAAVIGLLGIMDSGACAASLNPTLHPQEIVAFASSSRLSASLLTRRQYEAIAAQCSAKQVEALGMVFLVPDDKYDLKDISVVAQEPGPQEAVTSADAGSKILDGDALIIFTSGSSGTPKAVVLTHSSLLERAHGAIEALEITATDRALMTLPLCHVFGLTRQLFPHLLVGAAVHLVPASAPIDVVNHVINSRDITTFSGVPFHYFGMLQRGAGTRYAMKALRLATSSSMRMAPELRRALAASLPHTRFSSQYGLTETSGFVTALAADLFLKKPDSVGRCIPGVEIKVSPSDMVPGFASAHRAAGELLVRGTGLMRCYLNDASATHDAFTEDGWFRTGDMASVDGDGDVTIISRKQHLIKRAGEFIIPEEVERVMIEHRAVAEACVFGVPHRELGESVRAMAVVRGDEEVSRDEILAICRSRLARFKIPDDIRFVEALEKTSLGKVNKRAVVEQYLAELEARPTADGIAQRSANSRDSEVPFS